MLRSSKYTLILFIVCCLIFYLLIEDKLNSDNMIIHTVSKGVISANLPTIFNYSNNSNIGNESRADTSTQRSDTQKSNQNENTVFRYPTDSDKTNLFPHEYLSLIDKSFADNRFQIHLPFLPEYKSPCWNESMPHPSQLYLNNIFDKFVKNHLEPHFAALRDEYMKEWKRGQHWRVRCLPHFYVVGFPKCGTTDLFHRMVQHPHICRGRNKELHFWTKGRFGKKSKGIPMGINDYIDMFDDKAREFTYECGQDVKEGFKPCITGEASVSTAWLHTSEHLPDRLPDEPYAVARAEDSPAAGAIHKVTPQAKILAIVRNPVTRTYSDYLFFKRNTSRESFHERTVEAIDTFNKCIEMYDLRRCTFHTALNSRYPVRIHIAMYYVLLKDWFDLFGEHQLHIIPMEKYSADVKAYMQNIFEFLDLEPITEEQEAEIANLYRSNSGDKLKSNVGGDMFPETRTLLQNFFQPYNKLFSDMMKDDRFLWKD